ncbi:MAG TPA: valine--tRNA ligase [Candidatus Latescibacteria bacterium]|jgi:valyl-tRNA synthetase|nr:valine--tRNA ligase [Gemmatimonadaceae bacterium]MDP6018782.1 valine--tRNA ligase [Candidatus Latescibacterota bacterium]HJP31806.1 valine--tRNA ligase [Candidatus Latescibacterota bacterium]
MTTELPTQYDPQHCETTWYSRWEEAGYFRARADSERPPYCITIPPPNVTGELHMGHAVQHAIHDNVTRRKRMQGYETLCLPGTDHAGIATQMKVEEKLLADEGKTRYDVGREGLIERIWAWRETYGDAIYDQLRKLGCSYDWDRSRFTLDDGYVDAVLQAFEAFHEQGWIYRGTRMINWCPHCGTVISDLETEERLTQGKLWHIRYPGCDGGPDVTVATTRPETMLGDTGVAVHPSDPRWQAAVGKQVMLPLMERAIPIVADEYADPEMGSGAVKVTPAHDPNDYEVGARHDLPQVVVIGFDGVMTERAGAWAGQDRYACRKQVIAALEGLGLLVQVDDYEHAVPHHDKCGTVIEPLPMEQWFMNMRDLADKVRPHLQGAGGDDQVRYEPDRYRGYALEWLDNIRDWALSRQIWWGHRIPAWYCADCSGDGLTPLGGYEREQALNEGAFRVSVDAGARPIVAVQRPAACAECGGSRLVQDPDVLDTWFSSALWPFATLGWPDRTGELARFHPTDLMITGRDILYLWVLRMVMTATEFLQEVPFRQVLIHPTILTQDGKRMSKSLGTGLNPLDLVRLYGADATRYSLLAQCGTTQDVRFDADIKDNVVQASASAEAGRNFCNKLWNAARYVLMNLDGDTTAVTQADADELADRWILSRLAQTIRDIDEAQESFRFSDVTRALHDFLRRDYCDWYIELAKPRLLSGSPDERARVQGVLVHVLEQALRLMHPIMPFLTEEIWQQLPLAADDRPESLMIAAWPEIDAEAVDAHAEREMAFVQEVITAARTIRSELKVPPARKVPLVLSAGSQPTVDRLQARSDYVQALVGAESLDIGTDLPQPPGSGSAVVGDIEIFLPLDGLIDVVAERERLSKEIDKLQGLITRLEKKLSNEGFLQKAPEAVVDKERQRREEYSTSVTKLISSLEALNS